MGVCNCSMFCCTLLYVYSSIAIILMGKRELYSLLNLSSWCLMMVEGLFLAVPQGCLGFVIVVLPDHTHLLFMELSTEYQKRHFINHGYYAAFCTPGYTSNQSLLNLSSWCLMMVEWLFLAVPWGCLRFVIVVFPEHAHLLFMI